MFYIRGFINDTSGAISRLVIENKIFKKNTKYCRTVKKREGEGQ